MYAALSFAPPGLAMFACAYPRLAAWAAFFRRFAAAAVTRHVHEPGGLCFPADTDSPRRAGNNSVMRVTRHHKNVGEDFKSGTDDEQNSPCPEPASSEGSERMQQVLSELEGASRGQAQKRGVQRRRGERVQPRRKPWVG